MYVISTEIYSHSFLKISMYIFTLFSSEEKLISHSVETMEFYPHNFYQKFREIIELISQNIFIFLDYVFRYSFL